MLVCHNGIGTMAGEPWSVLLMMNHGHRMAGVVPWWWAVMVSLPSMGSTIPEDPPCRQCGWICLG